MSLLRFQPGRVLSGLLLLLVALASLRGRAAPFQELHVFGDSFSTVSGGPYFQGRWCNGIIWSEHLTRTWALPDQPRNSHAQSQATANAIQLQCAAVRTLQGGTALCVIFAGAWDFGPAIHQGLSAPGWISLSERVLAANSNAVRILYANGARNIALLNQPDFARFPEFESLSGNVKLQVRARLAGFNQQLNSTLASLRNTNPGLNLHLVDLFALVDIVLDTPDLHGFTESRVAAIHDPRLTDKSFNGPGRNHVFWDMLMFTSRMHALIADGIHAAVAGTRLSLIPTHDGLILAAERLQLGRPLRVESSQDAITWSPEAEVVARSFQAALLELPGTPPTPLQRFFRVAYPEPDP